MGILTAFLLALGITKHVFKGSSFFFALDEKCYNPDFSTFCTNHQVRPLCASYNARWSVVSSFCSLTARDSQLPKREERAADGNKGRPGVISCCCVHCELCAFKVKERKLHG